jgi:hypothetical protein
VFTLSGYESTAAKAVSLRKERTRGPSDRIKGIRRIR